MTDRDYQCLLTALDQVRAEHDAGDPHEWGVDFSADQRRFRQTMRALGYRPAPAHRLPLRDRLRRLRRRP